MDLIIVESPSKAKTIEKYLGHRYKVLASAGHIRDLPEKRLGIQIDDNFKPEYVLSESKKDIINKLKNEVKKSDKVYLATDPDREGEAISWHLKEVLGIKDDKVRIEFNEITKKAVGAALEKPRSINYNLVNAQQARRVLDRLVGYKLSPIISNKIKSGLSAGRVQSVALKMLVDRENEIRNFKVEEYWNVFAMLAKNDNNKTSTKAPLSSINGEKVKITCEEQARGIEKELKHSEYSVSGVKKSVSKSFAPPPFTTSTLQQDATSKLSLTAAQVMQLAQQLYEGVEIPGEGHVALVTYIRTDSVRVASEAQYAAKDFICKTYGNNYAPERFNFYKTKANAQDAHEAIRPVSLERTPALMENKLQRNLYRLYKLIFERFLASQMVNAEYDTLTVDIDGKSDTGNNYGFKIKGKRLSFDGFLRVYKHTSSEEEDVMSSMPAYNEGDKLTLTDVISEQKFTTPPARFSDSTLIKAMEENGIGRPSTYATILTVLTKREYAVKDKKFLKPTQLGEVVCSTLEKFFPKIMNIKFTAGMETQLDEIEEGKEWQKIIADFYPDFNKSLLEARNDHAKYKLNDEVTDIKCDKCGANMVVKEGRYGKFLGCPNYPDCKNVKPYARPVSKCPKCQGDIYKKISKTGKVFYSCGNYPKCDFISWDLPAPYFCPECGSIVKIIFKNGEQFEQCTKSGCTYNKKIEKHDEN